MNVGVLLNLLLGTFLLGEEITISLVAEKGGERVPLQELSECRHSPFGGWVVVSWCFGMTVDERPIFEPRERLMEEVEGEAGDEDIAEELIPEAKTSGSRVYRPSSVKIDLGEGEHIILPGEIKFDIRKGKLISNDPRVRTKDSEVEIELFPVVVRRAIGGRSEPFRASVTYAGLNLLKGLEKLLSESSGQEAKGEMFFLRLTVYLPPSPEGQTYRLNGIGFTVGEGGEVELLDGKEVGEV